MTYRAILTTTILLIVAGTACRRTTPVTTTAPAPQPAASTPPMLDAPEITVTEFLRDRDQVKKDSQSALVSAWKKIPGWNQYRLARSTDFKMSEWTGERWGEVERQINDPYQGGEMGGAQGLAAIVIDKRISDVKKYSCVVFIARPASRYDVYWIFKNEDLSRFVMGRHSGDIYLDEYRDDGTNRVCDIQYSRKQKRWACEFYN